MFARVGASIILARILTPGDFGIMAMVLLITSLFSQIALTGATSAIVVKKNLDSRDLNTAFLLCISIGMLLCAALYFSASLFERLFDASGLNEALQISTIFIMIVSISCVSNAILVKNIRFGVITIISSAAVVFEMGIAIWLAYLGHGYWSLIWAWLVSEAMISIAKIAVVKWLPGIQFSKKSAIFIYRYLSTHVINNLLVYLYSNTDRVVISWLLGPTAFGLYTFALRMPSLVIDRIVAPATGVILPMLAKKEYTENMTGAFDDYSKVAKYLALISFPFLTTLFILAEPLVLLLWGEKWIEVILPMQILCVAYVISCIGRPLGLIFIAGKKPGVVPMISIIKLPFSYIMVTVSCLFWGLSGIAFGIFLRSLLFGIDYYFVKKYFGASFIYFLKQITPIILSTLFCGITMLVVKNYTITIGLSNVLEIAFSIIFGFFIFILTLQLFSKPTMVEVMSIANAVIKDRQKGS